MNDFRPKNILCPIDFSDLSDLALKYAAVGSREYGSTLTILHAERFDLPRYFSQAETDRLSKELHRAKAAVRKDLAEHVEKVLGPEKNEIALEFEVVEAGPVDAILKSVEKKSSDLIVLGTHGIGGVKRLLLGSVAENVIRYATVPVFTVRQKEHEFIELDRTDALPKLERILCPCVANERGKIDLSYAVSLAERFNSRLTVLYSEKSSTKDGDLSQSKEKLCDWISGTVKTKCNLEHVVRKGNAAEQIILHAREAKVDLIVLGAHHKRFQDAMVLGRTTELVVRHAPVPVLIIPTFPDNRGA